MKLLDFKKSFRFHLYEMGLSDYQIAKICKVTPQAIQMWRKRNGYEPNYKTIKVDRNNECK